MFQNQTLNFFQFFLDAYLKYEDCHCFLERLDKSISPEYVISSGQRESIICLLINIVYSFSDRYVDKIEVTDTNHLKIYINYLSDHCLAETRVFYR